MRLPQARRSSKRLGRHASILPSGALRASRQNRRTTPALERDGIAATPVTVDTSEEAQVAAMVKAAVDTPRLGRPEDIAAAVLFLVSDRAGFITGITVPVHGGFSVHTPSYAEDVAMLEAMREAHGG